MPFLLFMPVEIGRCCNTSYPSPKVKPYSEVPPKEDFPKGL